MLAHVSWLGTEPQHVVGYLNLVPQDVLWLQYSWPCIRFDSMLYFFCICTSLTWESTSRLQKLTMFCIQQATWKSNIAILNLLPCDAMWLCYSWRYICFNSVLCFCICASITRGWTSLLQKSIIVHIRRATWKADIAIFNLVPCDATWPRYSPCCNHPNSMQWFFCFCASIPQESTSSNQVYILRS